MRILELSLLAFGPFRDARLDFSERPDALHIVYGPNEAGKSTALRALIALLYGVPRDTRDDHVHKKSELRIGGRLSSGAVEVSVVRRKGVRDTLLDPTGAPIDELVLGRMLGGVSEELFRTSFGLDHETLRRGGQAILDGGGEVGESLFGAAVGGAALHDTLAKLRAEADRLFTPQAHKRPINEAIRAFTEAQRASRHPMTESAWAEQHRSLEAAIAKRGELEERRRGLRIRQSKLRRARLTAPLLTEHASLVARRRELGDGPLLPVDAAADRRRVEREGADVAQRIAEVETAVLDLDRALGDLDEAGGGSDADVLRPEELEPRLIAYRAATRERDGARAELAKCEETIAALTRSLGSMAPARGGADVATAATETRSKKLALERAGLLANVHHAERAIATLEADRAALARRLATLEPPASLATLEALVASTPAAELAARLERTEAERDRLRDAASARCAGVGLGLVSLEDCARLPVPPAASVDRIEGAWRALTATQERTAAELEAAIRARDAAERAIEALVAAGAPPTEAELGRARAERDALWDVLSRAYEDAGRAKKDRGSGGALREASRAYERAVRDADGIADRLRREADRAAQLARLVADRAAHDRERERLEARGRDVAAELAAMRSEWETLWRPVGVSPLPPAEMRSWLVRHAALVEQVEALVAVEREHAQARAAVESRGAEIRRALADAGEPTASDDDGLGALAARAARTVREAEQRRRERREIETRIVEVERALERERREHADHAAALERWTTEWAQAVSLLGLGRDATMETVSAVVDARAELGRARETADTLRTRLQGAEVEIAAFEAHVQELASKLAPELAPDLARGGIAQAASEMLRRHTHALAARAQRTRLEQQLARERRSLGELRSRAARLEAALGELLAAAGASDRSALERAEERSTEARRLDARIGELETQLAQIGGASVATLDGEIADLAGADAAAELDDIDERLEALENELDQTNRTIGGIEKGFEDFERRSTAADAAAEAQQHLARLRAHVERYMTVKLACLVLERQIERYREENQAPLVARASTLLERLTLGSFQGLRAEYDEDDQPRLVCIRADGRHVGVEGLSDGTRDQLFLALRLATLERRSEVSEALPLVVDDVFIHFDDDRARAGLEALGHLADRMQIVFFTHHARLIELAREVVPAPRLRVHELAAARANTGARAGAAAESQP